MVNSRSGSPDQETGPEVLTAEQIEDHIQAAIAEIERDDLMDEILWWTFKDQFDNFTEEHFAAAKRTSLAKLRSILRTRGVWIEMDSKKARLPEAFAHAVEEEDMIPWTKKELQDLATNGYKKKILSELLIAQVELAEENYAGFDIRERSIPPPASTPTPAPIPAMASAPVPAPASTLPPIASIITPQDPDNHESYYATRDSSNMPGNLSQEPQESSQRTNQPVQSEIKQLNGRGSLNMLPERTRTISPTSYQFKMPPPDPSEAQRPLRPPGHQDLLASPLLPAPQPLAVHPSIVPSSIVKGMPTTAGGNENGDVNGGGDGNKHMIRNENANGDGRELTNMSKIYTNDMKYGGTGDNFSIKLVRFKDICNRIRLPQTDYTRAFPIMLKSLAEDFYYDMLIYTNMTFEQLCKAIQDHFEDANYKRNNLTEWHMCSLKTTAKENPGKSTTECFLLLVNKLQKLYHGLKPGLKSEDFMVDKLILACQDVPECQIACTTPPETLSALISSLKTSILAYEHAHGVDREECNVELPSGPTKFRTTVVKPYHSESDNEDEEEPQPPRPPQLEQQSSAPTGDSTSIVEMQPQTQPLAQPPVQAQEQPVRRKRGRPRKHPLPESIMTEVEMFIGDVFIEDILEKRFEQSRQKEIDGLVENGVFELVQMRDLPPGVRLFNSRFVDEVKDEGTDKAFEKSRLVIQAYNDVGKSLVLTQSPTIQRVSQRIVLSIAAIFPEYNLYLRDITQAYTQSTTKLVRDFYTKPPENVEQWQGHYLKVVKPLYGVPEAGNHWFNTYHKHHTEKLQMMQSTYDPCLLFANEGDYFGLVGLQTDDTLFVGTESFASAEDSELKKAHLMSKDREQLTIGNPIKFNGCKISLQDDGSMSLTQEKYNKTLDTVQGKPTDLISSRGAVRPNVSEKDQYVAQRARGAYLATMSQPEAAFDLSFAAQMTNPDENDIKLLNKRLQWQIDNPKRGLKYVRLDRDSLKLIVFTDSSFANNKDYTSQIGYVIVLADKNDNANILHWSSTKCRRITRSVLASELYAMSNGYDMAISVKTTIELTLGLKLPLIVCTDSKSLYDCLVKLGTTQEKRLMVDLMCLRQSYERREIAEVKWIDGDSNPADAMTKSKGCSALRDLIDTNKVNIKVTEWVERENLRAF